MASAPYDLDDISVNDLNVKKVQDYSYVFYKMTVDEEVCRLFHMSYHHKVDNWLKQKRRKKLKRATISQPKVNLESSKLQVSNAETLNDHEELNEGDDGEHDEDGAEATPDESAQENEAAPAEPEPDNGYDSAFESDYGSDDEF
ncbi:hypothetical protein ACROYT_G015282 [Oculina patagonica]